MYYLLSKNQKKNFNPNVIIVAIKFDAFVVEQECVKAFCVWLNVIR